MRFAIIPARGGSVRIPRKNITPFRGRPMMEWPIEAAKASQLFDHIIVSTDDREIAQLAKSLDCEVHMRSADDGTTGTQEIAARVLTWAHAAPSDAACVIYPCSPMLDRKDIAEMHFHWRLCHSVPQTWKAFARTVIVNEGGWTDAGCLYWGWARSFMDRVDLDGSCLNFEVPADRFIDINTQEDWQQAESMFDALHGAANE